MSHLKRFYSAVEQLPGKPHTFRDLVQGGGGGQQFAGDSNSPIFIVPQLKLTSVLILKVPYSIEKCATCLDTFLRF